MAMHFKSRYIFYLGRRGFHCSPRFRELIKLNIDGKDVEIEKGAALIQACEKAGVHIPRFCYHERLRIAGNCRMCLVELEKSPKAVASCAMPAANGMVVHTNTQLVHKAREGVMEFLLANHPLDCPICDQGGECDLQEQSMRYGSDRGRFHEMTGKRAVEDKNIGPLIKTIMTRCIHCTRCVRFANEVCGAPELGSSGRGNDMQIGTYIETSLKTELSGNVIDLCPVGALTSKPYAFRARPWELKRTETIDTQNALGCPIRADSRGTDLLRVLPIMNDDINEEWIDDRTRFAVDGQNSQRLAMPYVKDLLDPAGNFQISTWDGALQTIKKSFEKINPAPNELKFIAGQFCDAETLVVAKDLAYRFGSQNLALDTPNGNFEPAHGVGIRSNYLFNSTIKGIEDTDLLIIVGCNPRHEAAVLNARIRKCWLRSNDLDIYLCGPPLDLTYQYNHVGTDINSLITAMNKGDLGKRIKQAKYPMIIMGSGLTEHPEADTIFNSLYQSLEKYQAKFLNKQWIGYNMLQRHSSRVASYDIGFVTTDKQISKITPKIIWLLGADEIDPGSIPKDAFVIYQGSHGDVGASIADVVLPAFTPYEKSAIFVNTEGRSQLSRAAVSPPGVAREDWKILRAASEYLGVTLPYNDVTQVHSRIANISPNLLDFYETEPISFTTTLGLQEVIKNKNTNLEKSIQLSYPISNFYLTNAIARNSTTMARCSEEFVNPGTRTADIATEV